MRPVTLRFVPFTDALSTMEPANSLYHDFSPWREEVNRLLLRDNFIDLDTAGIDDQYLISHHEVNQLPTEFVEWFAIKYDLHDFK